MSVTSTLLQLQAGIWLSSLLSATSHQRPAVESVLENRKDRKKGEDVDLVEKRQWLWNYLSRLSLCFLT